MRRRTLTCGLIAGVLVLVAVLCAVAVIGGFIGLGQLAESLPTSPPRPTLVVGETYWIGAIVPPPGLPAGLVVRYANLQNKPGSTIKDPGVTIVAMLDDATEVKLTGIRDDWCYVETSNEFGRHVEGWLECNRLLDYRPTPVPTPNLTPEKP